MKATNMSQNGIALLLTVALAVSGCAYLQFQLVCDPQIGDCTIGIGVGGDICTDGTPVPEGEDCVRREDLGSGSLGNMSIVTNTNYGISIDPGATIGTVTLYENGSIINQMFTPYIVQGNAHTLQNPGSVANWFNANLTNPVGNYSMVMRPPNFSMTSSAAEGTLVSMTSTLYSGSAPVASDFMQYTAGQSGEPVYMTHINPL